MPIRIPHDDERNDDPSASNQLVSREERSRRGRISDEEKEGGAQTEREDDAHHVHEEEVDPEMERVAGVERGGAGDPFCCERSARKRGGAVERTRPGANCTVLY